MTDVARAVRLTEEQDAVVKLPSTAKSLVWAPPGSGKTRVIVERVAHLVEERGLAAARIACFAFTRRAAHELRERIVRRLGSRGESVSVTTLLSWFRSNVLPKNMVGRVVLDPEQSASILRSMYVGAERVPATSRFGITRMRELLSTIAAEGESALDSQTRAARSLVEVERIRHRAINAIGLHHIMPACLNGSTRSLRSQFDHVFVDEAQDLTPLEARAVCALGCPYTAVGDHRQAIFSFRRSGGGHEELLSDFADERRLTTTHRFGIEILSAIRNRCGGIARGVLSSQDAPRGQVRVASVWNPKILNIVGAKHGLENVLILARTNAVADRIAADLGDKAYRVRPPSDLVAKAALSLANLAIGRNEAVHLRVLWRGTQDDCSSIIRGAGARTTPLNHLREKHPGHPIIRAVAQLDATAAFGEAIVVAHRYLSDMGVEVIGDVNGSRFPVDVLKAHLPMALSEIALLGDRDYRFVAEGKCAVSTIHAAKGAEADAVVLIDFRDRGPEDLCVRFVGMTRARKELVIVERQDAAK